MRLAVWMMIVLTAVIAQPYEKFPEYTDVPYHTTDPERQVLDIYLPSPTDSPPPVLFFIHGGGYLLGDKETVSGWAGFMNQQGYAVVAPNYRLGLNEPFPAAINDIVCALAFTYAHAEEYGFDTSRLLVAGDSAGAHAAVFIGTSEHLEDFLLDGDCAYPAPEGDWAHGVIAYYPYADLSTCESECLLARNATALYLGIETYDPAAWGNGSAIAEIDTEDPPMLLLHGTADEVVPISESEYLLELLTAAEIPAELIRFAGAPHAFVNPDLWDYGLQAAEIAAEWIAARLVDES